MKKEYITPVSKVKRIDTESLLNVDSAYPEQGGGTIFSKEDWFSDDEETEKEGSTPIYTYNVWEQPDKQ